MTNVVMIATRAMWSELLESLERWMIGAMMVRIERMILLEGKRR